MFHNLNSILVLPIFITRFFGTCCETLLNFHFDDFNHRSLITINFFHNRKNYKASLGYHGEQIDRLRSYVHIQKKRGANFCHSPHVLKAPELPDHSKRATPKTPRWYIYSQQTRTSFHNIGLRKMLRMQCIYATQGLPRCFVFDWSFECSKFLERQNQSVQLRLFMYMSPTLAFPHERLSARIGFAKVRNKSVIQN